jgi:hypothetical protein
VPRLYRLSDVMEASLSLRSRIGQLERYFPRRYETEDISGILAACRALGREHWREFVAERSDNPGWRTIGDLAFGDGWDREAETRNATS